MTGKIDHRMGLLAVVIGLAYFVGYFVADDSAKIEELQANIERLSHRLPKAPLSRKPSVSRSVGSAPGSQMSRESTSASVEASSLMTENDWEVISALEHQREQGQFVLEYESPFNRKLRDLLIEKQVFRTASDVEPEYQQIFSKLGISSDASESLKSHVAKINKASLETSTAIQQLQLARNAYDERLRSLCSPEDYSKYRQFEDSKNASREYQSLQKYVAGHHTTLLDPAFEERLVSLIRETKAYTQESWSGPFDPIPNPAVGKEMVTARLSHEIRRISEHANQALDKASEFGIPEDYKTVLAAYFSDNIQEKQRMIEMVNRPAEATRRAVLPHQALPTRPAKAP